jgi:hypothetical protein
MTLREKIESHRFSGLNRLDDDDCDRLLVALDTLEAVEFMQTLDRTRGLSGRTPALNWLPTIKMWEAVDAPSGCNDTAETLPEAVSKLRAAMKEGT